METYQSQNLPTDFFEEAFLSAWQQIKIAVVIVVGFIPLLVFAVPRLKRVAYLALSSTASYSLLAFITLLAGVLFYLPETITSYHAGQLQRVTLEMFRSERLAFPVQPKENVNDLVVLYQKTAYPRGFPREETPVPWDRQAESLPNIVLVIIETAPYRDVMTPSFEAQLPRIAALRPRALFAHQHFTTSPYSVRSVFSQLTGMYDLPTRKMIADFLMLDDHPSRLDSLPIVLGKLGYESVYYFPLALTHPNEEWMLKYLGFSRIVTGDIGGEGFHSQANMQLKRAREEQMFTRAIADVKTSAAKKQPFLYVLMTSLGHEPIVDIRPEDERLADPNPPRSLIVHNLLGMIDSLTGELLDALKETKLFENTIFIVTADHGVRNRLNDPED
ncbi:MAG: sulfatase-like hydrolase/transferase [Deltaproteobacteria bacterium]|nr:sulfatase-like hydrolase/transferase [Deltaproteobacteria bacterium]